MQQIAALPYRITAEGQVEVLLITSRQSGQWIIPKGNPIKGLKAHQAAAQEAFEEAGISGEISKKSVGTFHYLKRKLGQTDANTEVVVFPLLVTQQHRAWPERGQRKRRWLDPIHASHLTDNTELKRLLLVFHLNFGS